MGGDPDSADRAGRQLKREAPPPRAGKTPEPSPLNAPNTANRPKEGLNTPFGPLPPGQTHAAGERGTPNKAQKKLQRKCLEIVSVLVLGPVGFRCFGILCAAGRVVAGE